MVNKQQKTLYALVVIVVIVVAFVAYFHEDLPDIIPIGTPTPQPTAPNTTPTPPNTHALSGEATIRITIYYTTQGIPPAVIERTGSFSVHELAIWNDIYPIEHINFAVSTTLSSTGSIGNWQTNTQQKIEVYQQGNIYPVYSSTGPESPIMTGSSWQNGETKTLSSMDISSATLDNLVAQYGDSNWSLQCNCTVNVQASGYYQAYQALTPAVSFPFYYTSPNYWDLGIVQNTPSSW
jgi:hypothetical protein